MEISTEINKIFGEEMARLFSSQITDEELMNEARRTYEKLRSRSTNYLNSYGDSEFEKILREQIAERYKKACSEYLESETIKEDIDVKAKELVDSIRSRAEEKIIEAASDAIKRTYQGLDANFISAQIYNALRG